MSVVHEATNCLKINTSHNIIDAENTGFLKITIYQSIIKI